MKPSELISKWQHVLNELPLPTWTEPWNLAALCEMSSQCETILEMGCFQGMSTLAMLKANPHVHIWSCDIFTAFEFNQAVAAHFLKDFIKSGNCELIKGTSDKAAEMLQHMRGKIDGCFIDAGHSTDLVLKDIRNCLPLLRSGATMLGHDFDIPHNDVALGVIQSGIAFDTPLPRLWRHFKT